MRRWKVIGFEQMASWCCCGNVESDGVRRCFDNEHNPGKVCAPSTCHRWRSIGRADLVVVKLHRLRNRRRFGLKPNSFATSPCVKR